MNWNDFVIYDPTSVTFFRWKTTITKNFPEHAPAGRSRPNKGVEVSVPVFGEDGKRNTKSISGARLAWLLHYNEVLPDDKWVVCLDGNLQNLSISNLCVMTFSQRKLYTSYLKGDCGVEKRCENGGWFVRIRRKNGTDYHYSHHKYEWEARLASMKALKALVFEVE